MAKSKQITSNLWVNPPASEEAVAISRKVWVRTIERVKQCASPQSNTDNWAFTILGTGLGILFTALAMIPSIHSATGDSRWVNFVIAAVFAAVGVCSVGGFFLYDKVIAKNERHHRGTLHQWLIDEMVQILERHDVQEEKEEEGESSPPSTDADSK